MVIGQKTMFVRTAGCDYSCVWCDSAFTWNGTAKEEIRMLTAEEILGELRSKGHDRFSHVTISGGNPALLKSLHTLIEPLHDEDITVALETQGSVWQDWFLLIDELTLSPKPPSSRMSTDWEMLDMIVHKLSEHRRHFCLKVVVFDDTDLTYATMVHQRYPEVPMFLQAGNDDVLESDGAKLADRLKERYETLIEAVMASNELNRVRVLPQLHTWIWGNKRGV
jgi:7-carboxy-7-deazaguanine synthase